jgi:Transcriptional regulator containing PAS, AAA-type ATPase, and DNA-binding domains
MYNRLPYEGDIMDSILISIQPDISRFADIISRVLKVDVEIVDSNLVRVAGTGKYKKFINKCIEPEGCIYKSVIEDGKTRIVREPGKDTLCMGCPRFQNCSEVYEVCTPVKVGENIVGVIGLICFDNGQKKHLLGDFDTYMKFLYQISDIIAITAIERCNRLKEKTMLTILNLVIEKMDRGVIVLSRSGRLTHVNKKALEILCAAEPDLKGEVVVDEINEGVMDSREYKIKINGCSFDMWGGIYPIGLNDNEFDRMLIFQDPKSIKTMASNFGSLNPNVLCGDIYGESKPMKELKLSIKRIARSVSTVLITGESGTGKEMVARAIHYEGSRSEGPFIALNCGAIPYELLESELFGYIKGAFTGASPTGRIGKFELAGGGTIFLDEIGDMPLSLQVKLLRVLQERKIVRIGSNKPVDIDVRVIASTNRNLSILVEENKFRRDLYYRLNVIPLSIPPLRERIEDIDILSKYFVKKYASLLGKGKLDFGQGVLEIFKSYSWPGNVRELENTIEFMVNMADMGSSLTKELVPNSILKSKNLNVGSNEEIHPLKDLERIEIVKALKMFGYSTEGKKKASQKLGVGLATLYRKMEEYNISNEHIKKHT